MIPELCNRSLRLSVQTINERYDIKGSFVNRTASLPAKGQLVTCRQGTLAVARTQLARHTDCLGSHRRAHPWGCARRHVYGWQWPGLRSLWVGLFAFRVMLGLAASVSTLSTPEVPKC
jgi:hypothetical protein